MAPFPTSFVASVDSPRDERSDSPTMQMPKKLGSGGRSALSASRLLLVGMTCVACGPTLPQLRATAAKDFNCPQSEIKLAHVDSNTMDVNGCGYQAIYSSCKKDEGCNWKADTAISDQSGP